MPTKGSRIQYGSYRLFPVWEKFCHHVVDAFGENEEKTLRRAYELANNLQPTTDKKVRQMRYKRASEWMKKGEIKGRCEEIEKELYKNAPVNRERIIQRNELILEGDPIISYKEDEETGQYVWKKINEIPKFWRKLVTHMVLRGRVVYILDKVKAQQTLIDLKGMEEAKKVSVTNGGLKNLRLGFEDDED